jgi:hypothetical protein
MSIAQSFRDNELPFKIFNIPDLDTLKYKWNDKYLKQQMSKETISVEKSKNNHFMYWNMRLESKSDYIPPTEVYLDLNLSFFSTSSFFFFF